MVVTENNNVPCSNCLHRVIHHEIFPYTVFIFPSSTWCETRLSPLECLVKLQLISRYIHTTFPLYTHYRSILKQVWDHEMDPLILPYPFWLCVSLLYLPYISQRPLNSVENSNDDAIISTLPGFDYSLCLWLVLSPSATFHPIK